MATIAPRSIISRLPMVNMMKVNHQIFRTIFSLFALSVFVVAGRHHAVVCYRSYPQQKPCLG